MRLLFALAAGKALINTPKLLQDTLPELDSTVKAIATEIQQGDDRQREIIETAKQRARLMLCRFRGGKRPEEAGVEGTEEESEVIDWWELKQEPEANYSDTLRVCFGDDILLKPDTRYCFFPATGVSPAPGVEAKAYSRSAAGDDSNGEDSNTSDESCNNRSNEDEADADSDVQYVTTTFSPFRVSNEIIQYCTTLELKKTKQEPISDSAIPNESEVDVAKLDSVYYLDIISPAHSTKETSILNEHKQTHLPIDQRPKRRKRPKTLQCDYESCNYITGLMGNLKRHKQTHLPSDQRSTRPRVHQCDHEGCHYGTDRADHLKRHKQTHLSADQRPTRPRVQCDHEGCSYTTDHPGNLKKHKQNHLPADQRPKRKANDQLPSSEKRKKTEL